MNYPANRKLLKTLETSKEQIKELIDNDIDYDSNNEFISNYSALTDLLQNIEWSIEYLKDSDLCNLEGNSKRANDILTKYK